LSRTSANLYTISLYLFENYADNMLTNSDNFFSVVCKKSISRCVINLLLSYPIGLFSSKNEALN